MDDTWQSADYRRLLVSRLDPAIAQAMAMDFDPLGAEERDGRLALYFEGSIDPLLLARLREGGAHLESEPVVSWDWFRGMREAFHAIRPFEGLVVRPPWEEAAGGGEEIVIEPGAAFGTGLHATTQAMLRFMKDRVLPGRTFLDIGAGSGILSIYAAHVGARATAIENDRLAIGNLLKNRAMNPRGCLRVVCGEPACLTGCFEVVAANLTFPVLRGIVADLDRLATGSLLLSGIVTEESLAAERFASSLGRVDAVAEAEGWVALAVERR